MRRTWRMVPSCMAGAVKTVWRLLLRGEGGAELAYVLRQKRLAHHKKKEAPCLRTCRRCRAILTPGIYRTAIATCGLPLPGASI